MPTGRTYGPSAATRLRSRPRSAKGALCCPLSASEGAPSSIDHWRISAGSLVLRQSSGDERDIVAADRQVALLDISQRFGERRFLQTLIVSPYRWKRDHADSLLSGDSIEWWPSPPSTANNRAAYVVHRGFDKLAEPHAGSDVSYGADLPQHTSPRPWAQAVWKLRHTAWANIEH